MQISQLLPSKQLFRTKSWDIIRLALFAAMFTMFSLGCKKGSDIEVVTEPALDPNPINLSDSIYFQMDGKVYASNETYSNFISNSGVNMKFLDTAVTGMKSWGSIGGKSYYSSVDSIYFSYGRRFVTSTGNHRLSISFGKRFHTANLNYSGAMWYPWDIRKMLDTGKHDFATDYQNTNAIDGVSFDFNGLGTTGMPEYSFKNSSDTYLQHDAQFEITKKEEVDENRYRIEAKFEMNVYDADRKKHRATNGFVRLNVYRAFIGKELF